MADVRTNIREVGHCRVLTAGVETMQPQVLFNSPLKFRQLYQEVAHFLSLRSDLSG
jgi:hypothetical protein